MTRPTRRPTRCEVHGRVVHRSQDAAIREAIGLFRLVPQGSLAVYYCESERAWHVTTRSYKAALRVVVA